MTDQPPTDTPDARTFAARFCDALFHRGPGYDLTPAPPCLNANCTLGCTTECRAVIQQAWARLHRTQQPTPATCTSRSDEDHACMRSVDHDSPQHAALEAGALVTWYDQPTPVPDNSRTTADNPGTSDDATDNPSPFPTVQGRCPACGLAALFLGAGGYVTCRSLCCPEPDAASSLLEQRAAGCPSNETQPNRCACDCEGCKHNCAAHQEPATAGLGDQYAAAIRPNMLLGLQDAELHDAPGTERINDWVDWIATAVAGVRDTAMEQLRAQVALLEQHANALSAMRDNADARADQVEEELVGVRSTLDRVQAALDYCDRGSVVAIRAALDGPSSGGSAVAG